MLLMITLLKKQWLMQKPLLATILSLLLAGHVFAKELQEGYSFNIQNKEIKTILQQIENETNYRFLFSGDLKNINSKTSLVVRNAEMRTILDRLLKDKGLSYQVMENNLVIIKPESRAVSSDLVIKGNVAGENGKPLGGVSVLVKGSNKGTVTDNAGNFTLAVPNRNAVLVFSFVGYAEQEQTIQAGSVLQVILTPSNSSLADVVVVGYGTQRKRDLTGTITTVKGEDIAKAAATNPMAALQGRVAGLTIVNSGRAGASPTVRIRGVNSTNASDPLYVVDGVFQSNIDFLNPADIESVEVLRDPSSIAIFGLQGGNGVIIITTKKAAKGETRISLQSMVGVQKVINKIDVTNAAGFKKLYAAQLANLNAAPFDFTNYNANTNWQDLIFRDAVINTNTVSVSNSSEKTTTYLSLGYNFQDGVLKYDNYKKYIGRLNEEIRVSKNLKVGGEVTGFHWQQKNPGADLNNALWAAPIVPVQADNGMYYSMPSFQRAQVSNPVARLNQSTGNAVNTGYRIVGNVFGEVKFLQYFTWRSSFYTDLGFNDSRNYTPLPFTYINLGEGAARTDTTFDRTARTSVSQAQALFRKFQQDHVLTFSKSIKQHNITALAGFTTLFTGSSNVSGTRKDTTLNVPANPDLWYLGIVNASNPITNSGGGSEQASMSYFGRINYAFASKYLLNASLRRDGNSKYSPRNKWGTFGSIGVGWVVSDEAFFKKIHPVNFLKLRGAWGTVGNGLGFGDYLFFPVLNQSNVGVFGDNVYPSVSPAFVPDPNLHWEVVKGLDLGMDVRALRNRLSAEVTVYNKKTKDILTELTLPGTAGDYKYRTNLGTISNKGIEVSLGWRDKIGKNITYSLTPNFSYNINKVESIGNNIDFQILGNSGVNKTQSGYSIGYFYGYKQTGIYQTVAQLDKMPHFASSLPGDIAYADINGDGVLDGKDRTYLGTPFPPYNFGFNFSLAYKEFDLVVDGQGVAGNKVYTQRRTGTFAVLNFEANRLNAWTTAGSTNVEPILDNTRGNNYLFSNYFLEPGDYFRLRTLQVGYNFNARTLSAIGLKQLRLYVSGQNIATFSRTSGYTPEAPLSNPIAGGADNGVYPVPAVYSIGINANF